MIAETEEIFKLLLENENAENVETTDAIQNVLTEDLEFFESLNNDFHKYQDTLLPNQVPNSTDFIKFLKEEMQWDRKNLEYVQTLASELDGHDGVGFINDIMYAQELSKLLDAFMLAVETGDVAEEVRAESAARTLYTD